MQTDSTARGEGALDEDLEATRSVFDNVDPPWTPLTTSEVAGELDCVRRTAYNRLESLVDRGLLRTKKVGARGRIWWKPRPKRTGEGGEVSDRPFPDDSGSSTGEAGASIPDGQVEHLIRPILTLASLLMDASGTSRVTHLLETITPELPAIEDALVYRYDEERDVLSPSSRPAESRSNSRPPESRSDSRPPESRSNSRQAVSPDRTTIIGRVFRDQESTRFKRDSIDMRLAFESGNQSDVRNSTNRADIDQSRIEFGSVSSQDGERQSSETDQWGVAIPLGTHGVFVCTLSGKQKEKIPAGLLASIGSVAETAFDRIDRKRAFDRQREETAVLTDVNGVLQEIHEAIVEQSTREEIEETVCDHLARSYWYSFAWIGSVGSKTNGVTPRVEVGVDGYADSIPLSTDASEPAGRGPVGRAVRSGEIQVVRNVEEDPSFELWREYADAFGYNGAAAIPIVHRDTVYGVLGVYTARTHAFGEDEREAISHLGETIGFAIAAVERKRALMGDDLVELELDVPNAFDGFGDQSLGPLPVSHAVPVGDGDYLLYGTVPNPDESTSDQGHDGDDRERPLQIVERGVGNDRFEMRVSDPHVMSVLADHGTDVVSGRIEGSDLTVTCRMPPSVNPRRVLAAVRAVNPDATLTARRQVTRDSTAELLSQTVTDDLTERQRSVLEASYLAGYFDWPRANSGTEIAASLGISPATFHQHLRIAQRKILDDVVT
ncbi:MAG: GAF domain-containing protein [Halodesulfurarchaeum sp.]